MFNQFGEPSVATTSIALEVGISPGNLHYHYHSKEEIVTDLLAEFRRRIEITLAAPEQRLPDAEDCWLFLHLVVEAIWKYRFIYRDINDLVARYHVIEVQFRRILGTRSTPPNRFLAGLVKGGRMHASDAKIRSCTDSSTVLQAALYGPFDLSRHVDEVRRLVPLMTRVLPDSGLATIAHAMDLNALSESLDGAMVEALGEKAAHIDDALYAAAYRAVDRAKDRERQIDLIELLGRALDKLTLPRFIGMTLKLMRPPAQLAGLGELQAFLERGYAAFGAMCGGAGEFVSIVVARERAILEALLAGDDEALRRPLGLDAAAELPASR
jgi:AcrR family transcriptional regulator